MSEPFANSRSEPEADAIASLEFLLDAYRDGQDAVLCIITGLTGSGARSVGTVLTVRADGAFAGSFSSGCVEQAIVAEALDVLVDGLVREQRFGAGSPYIDIRLPCGGGIDVLFVPNPDSEAIQTCFALLGRRQDVGLLLDRAGSVHIDDGLHESGWEEDRFRLRLRPHLRLVIVGHGAETRACARLATELNVEAQVYSPDENDVAAVTASGAQAAFLKTPFQRLPETGDRRTAFLFLFHEHDWEPDLIGQALRAESFWVGAMGSSATHERRRRLLQQNGWSDADVDRVRGPIGLLPSRRDPTTLALSVLAEIVGAAA